MAFGIDDAVAAGSALLKDAIDKIWPNPEDKAKAEAVLMSAQADAAISLIKANTAVMLAEESSEDKWTSRARPSFLYVIYFMIMASVPMGIFWAYDPVHADKVVSGVQMWLSAIPDALWQLFGIGYLGYTGFRSADKAGGIVPMITGGVKSNKK